MTVLKVNENGPNKYIYANEETPNKCNLGYGNSSINYQSFVERCFRLLDLSSKATSI